MDNYSRVKVLWYVFTLQVQTSPFTWLCDTWGQQRILENTRNHCAVWSQNTVEMKECTYIQRKSIHYKSIEYMCRFLHRETFDIQLNGWSTSQNTQGTGERWGKWRADSSNKRSRSWHCRWEMLALRLAIAFTTESHHQQTRVHLICSLRLPRRRGC